MQWGKERLVLSKVASVGRNNPSLKTSSFIKARKKGEGKKKPCEAFYPKSQHKKHPGLLYLGTI